MPVVLASSSRASNGSLGPLSSAVPLSSWVCFPTSLLHCTTMASISTTTQNPSRASQEQLCCTLWSACSCCASLLVCPSSRCSLSSWTLPSLELSSTLPTKRGVAQEAVLGRSPPSLARAMPTVATLSQTPMEDQQPSQASSKPVSSRLPVSPSLSSPCMLPFPCDDNREQC